MPSLAALKAKWFLPLVGDVLGVPQRRREGGPGPELQVSTDGNTVEMLIDGQVYMRRWHVAMLAMGAFTAPECYHAGWRYEGVYPLGHGTGPTALQDMDAAHTAGATMYTLLSEHVGSAFTNLVSVDWLRLHGIWTSCRDNRYPPAGSNHQKAAVFKTAGGSTTVLGSIDLAKPRWDRPVHAPTDPGRDPAEGPSHDAGVAITGPAVGDVELCFRERWNDSTRSLGMTPLLPRQPLISTPLAGGPATGTHSVQVLRTYGITSRFFGYSWSPGGEFTVWSSYLNAIRRATTYLYLEDQYFLPWDYPPRFSRGASPGRDVDIIYQLGEAMKRGVKVAILTPSKAEDFTYVYQKFQRDLGVNYLNAVKAAGAPGDLVVAALQNGSADVYVHSKLMLVDDEFVLVGSTNIGARSMTHDGEIHVGVVDSAEAFCREFRKALWAEHTGLARAALNDPIVAYGHFKTATAASSGHLKPYPLDPLSVYPPRSGTTPAPKGHPTAIRDLIDPYAGPPTLA
jgi:phosphatidylserine/phosphatidylglycerophosphate/cardiolipin synthase-like enzyme